MPIDPVPSRWTMPSPLGADDDLVAIGADLEPGTILAGYRAGLFPMPVDIDGKTELGWWSPEPRAILPLDGLRVTRSLRQSCHRFRVTVDEAFDAVISACAEPNRAGPWITPDIIEAYTFLHDLGWAHSVETWAPSGELAGGLYGVAIGEFFAGESMFYRARDASKVALVHLVGLLRDGGGRLLDVQWKTDHLASLGAVQISREEYLELLADAVEAPLPRVFAGVD